MSTDAQVPPADPGQAQPGQALPAADAPAGGQPPAATDGTVDKARFDGLMASHQRALGLLRQAGIDPQTGLKTQQAPPAAQPAPAAATPTPPPSPAPAPQPSADRPDLETMVEMLFTERVLDRYQAAVAAALQAYPNVVPFKDRLTGDTPEAILADAKAISMALGGDGNPAGGQPAPAAPAAGQPAPAATPEPRVQGGAPSAQTPAPQEGDPAAELAAIFSSRKPRDVKMQEYIAFKAAHPGVSLIPGGQVFSSWDRTGGSDQG